MGVRIPAELKTRVTPSKVDAGGGDGVSAKVGFAIWGDPDWRQYFYLDWDDETQETGTLSISVSLKFLQDPNGPSQSKARLRAPQQPYVIDAAGKEVYMWRRFAQDDLVNLDTVLSNLIRAWADAWREMGGIKPFLEGAGR